MYPIFPLTWIVDLPTQYSHFAKSDSLLHKGLQVAEAVTMLPDFLQSNFKRYKQDTDTVATWLAVKARQHGYPVDQLSGTDSTKPSATSKRLKGKARKQAKEAPSQPERAPAAGGFSAKSRYTIKIKDFVALAEFIAGYTNPIVQVPVELVKALNRAINLRAQHNDWSRQTKAEEDQEARVAADATHSYFLGVLDRVREVLKPRMPAETGNESLPQSVEGTRVPASLEAEDLEDFTNLFDMLDLEEPSQAFLDAPGVPHKPKAEKPAEGLYEAETDQSREEKYLASHCLFQDVRNIRSFIRQLWTNYKEHQLSLVSVSVATNTAICLVRDMEEEFIRRFPGTSGFEEVLGLFYPVQCLFRGESPENKQQPGDLFNFKVYDLAEDCLVTTYTTMSSLQDIIEPGILPVYKPGHFGYRDRSKDWDDMTSRGKFREDQLILFEAFPDLVLLSMITSRSPLAEDELIRGIRDMLPGRPIPLWLVFAGRCFLDIQHVMKRAVGLGYDQLGRTAEAMKLSIKENLTFHKSLRIENWPKSNDFQFTEMLGVIDSWVLRDVIAERRRKVKLLSVCLDFMCLTDLLSDQNECSCPRGRAVISIEAVSFDMWPVCLCAQSTLPRALHCFCKRLGFDLVHWAPVQRGAPGEPAQQNVDGYGNHDLTAEPRGLFCGQ